MRRLVARAAAGDHRDLRAIVVGADYHLDQGIPVEPRELALAEHHRGVDGLGDEMALRPLMKCFTRPCQEARLEREGRGRAGGSGRALTPRATQARAAADAAG